MNNQTFEATAQFIIDALETVAKSSYYKKSQLARMNKACLYELLEIHNLNICNVEHITKLEMIDCLLEIENQDYYTKQSESLEDSVTAESEGEQ